VITGIGKTSSAAGTAWLHGISEASPAAGWINLGISGHASLEPGEIRRVHKITDVGSGRSWYPPQVIGGECGISSAGLITVDRPAKEFSDRESLVDMEASGFVETAARFTSLEMIHCLKVVSDNAETGFDDLKGNRQRVSELVGILVAKLDDTGFFESVIRASLAEARRLADPPGFEKLVSEIHFTESQRHQLRRLLVRCNALGVNPTADLSGENSREILRFLEANVSQK
jgi:hypothetical protein